MSCHHQLIVPYAIYIDCVFSSSLYVCVWFFSSRVRNRAYWGELRLRYHSGGSVSRSVCWLLSRRASLPLLPIFWCFASFYYSSHITMLCSYESYMHVPAASYYLIPTSYKPLFVYMLALRVLVHAQVVSSLFYNLIWICYFRYNFTWYSLLLLVWDIAKLR